MELILPRVLPTTLTPTTAAGTLQPVAGNALSQTGVVNKLVKDAVPVLQTRALAQPNLVRGRLSVGPSNRSTTTGLDEGSLTPEAANILAAGFKQVGAQFADRTPGTQSQSREEAPAHRTSESQLVSPAEQAPATAIVADIVPEGAFSFERAPLVERVGSRRFGAQRHPILGVFKDHNGIDIGANPGSPIAAPTDGTVVYSGEYGGGGQTVIVDHGDRYFTKYMHMQPTELPPVGAQLAAGDTVGLVGSTGLSTGPHLHFELWEGGFEAHQGGRAIDPMPFWVGALPPEQQVQYREETQVKNMQRMLARVGLYTGEIDGDFGPMSQEALVNYIQAATEAGELRRRAR